MTADVPDLLRSMERGRARIGAHAGRHRPGCRRPHRVARSRRWWLHPDHGRCLSNASARSTRLTTAADSCGVTLASDRGGGVRALVQACRSGQMDAEVALIISNNARSPVLAFAADASIPHLWIGGPQFSDSEQRDRATLSALREHAVDLVVLLGYLKLLGPETVTAYRCKILNIHPALLPSFGGMGMYGMAVLAASVPYTGVTIHLVDEQYDHGSIIAATRVPIEHRDDASTLATRVNQREQTFLAETIQGIVSGRIVLPSV